MPIYKWESLPTKFGVPEYRAGLGSQLRQAQPRKFASQLRWQRSVRPLVGWCRKSYLEIWGRGQNRSLPQQLRLPHRMDSTIKELNPEWHRVRCFAPTYRPLLVWRTILPAFSQV